jgi:starch phosphorylase
MGKFSSDRTIREYCQEIWQVEPVKITLNAAKEYSKETVRT